MSHSPHRPSASPSDASDARRLDDSTSSALIHFAGRWTDEDRTIVERAIRHLESVRTSHAVRNLGEPWVCTFQHLGIGPFYTAHRAGHFQPLTARSARRLAFRLFGLSASGTHSE